MHRREFFSFAAGGAAVVPQIVRGEEKPFPDRQEPAEDLCKHYADRLAEELEKRHGVKWLIEISHENMTLFGKKVTPRAS